MTMKHSNHMLYTCSSFSALTLLVASLIPIWPMMCLLGR